MKSTKNEWSRNSPLPSKICLPLSEFTRETKSTRCFWPQWLGPASEAKNTCHLPNCFLGMVRWAQKLSKTEFVIDRILFRTTWAPSRPTTPKSVCLEQSNEDRGPSIVGAVILLVIVNGRRSCSSNGGQKRQKNITSWASLPWYDKILKEVERKAARMESNRPKNKLTKSSETPQVLQLSLTPYPHCN